MIEATTGADALRLAQSENPSLILMDVRLPDIDGWAVTRLLKDDPATRHIGILAFTAHALPADREASRKAGCDGYLAKPVEPLRLVQEVARFLER